MDKNSIIERIKKEMETPFEGWDFSYLTIHNRMHGFPLSWNYTNEVLREISKSDNVLDMGTGGGEYLSTLPLPKHSFATEGYKPNYEIAKKNLSKLGVKVVEVKGDDLPFKDNFFFLIINRHESFSLGEIHRILKRNGVFITQQVGDQNDREINELLSIKLDEDDRWNLDFVLGKIDRNLFTIEESKEDRTRTRFYDLGAIFYYMKCIPWQFGRICIEDKYKEIRNLQDMIEKDGYIDVSCHRFLLKIRKR